MGAEEQLLFDLAEAVLEGRPVDWTAAESTISESQRALLAHLRAVAGIASFHAGSSAADDYINGHNKPSIRKIAARHPGCSRRRLRRMRRPWTRFPKARPGARCRCSSA